MRTFRTIRKALVPRWLSEGEGQLVGYALDLMKDAFLERLRLGMLARFPENGPNGETAPADALIQLGRDRRVVRGISETDADYAVRLKAWLVDRRRAGNPFVLMKQLAAYCGAGTSFRTVDVRGNWYSRDENGNETSSLNTGNWDWDGDTDRWSRFWVVIYPGSLWAVEPDTWGTGVWGDLTGTWGTTATPEHANTLRAIVADWKPGGTNFNIILAFDAASFDPAAPEPNGTWDYWANRLSTARYLGA